jgi:hypothetical protein
MFCSPQHAWSYGLSLLSFGLFGVSCSQATMNTQTNLEQAFSCIITSKPNYKFGGEVQLQFRLQSHLPYQVSVLTWYTPLEGFFSPLVQIQNAQGQELKYQGIKLKRLTPTAQDYLALAAKQSLTAYIDLTQAYDLPPGHYLVTSASYKIRYQAAQAEPLEFQCPPQTLSFTINDINTVN